jgi:rubrerythrin
VPISFSGTELIDLAIGIEKKGITFYDVMAKSTEDPGGRALFQYLADWERRHIQVFQDMLGKADTYGLSGNHPVGNPAYFQALTENAVFTDEVLASELAYRANSETAALELSIALEKDSILFYYELRDTLPQRTHALLNKIIAEEKSHIRELSELKKQRSHIQTGEP